MRLHNLLTFLFSILFTLSMGQQRIFSGEIIQQDGRPIPKATIRLEPDKHIVQTNASGFFSFDHLYPGLYYIYIEHPHYEAYVDTITINAGRASYRNIILSSTKNSIETVEVKALKHSAESPDQLLQLNRSAMPVQIISRQMIELMGSRRLDEVLKEQTGIAIVNNIAGGSRSTGVQLQGFGSEYVMILIDGQPMVGRNNGNFDLSRISVSNIERIEIVKGASSCLFGSDALGGAINIITRYGAVEPQAQLSLSYGSLNITDVTLDAESPFAHQRGSIHLSSNFYRTDGFNTNPFLLSGQSSPPFRNFDNQVRLRYQLAKNTFIGTSIRFGTRRSKMSKNWDSEWIGQDNQEEKDLNYSLNLEHNFRSGIKSVSRYYLSRYDVDQFTKWQGQGNNNELNFLQTVHRLEQQLAKSYRNGLSFTAGFGGSVEQLKDASIGTIPNQNSLFAYLQGDKRLFEKLDVRAGLRYDHTASYGGKINPSAGLQYYLNEKISFKGGIGSGFKAPDYRMRYLAFFNPAANYLVIGNEILKETLNQMNANGEISEMFPLADRLNQNLKPERSISLNLGTQWKPHAKLAIEVGIFQHYLFNQIDAVPIATGTSVSQIYSYQNLPKAVNKGIEANIQWQLKEGLQLQVGYQYLIAKDLSVKDSIRQGNWPYNQNLHDPTTGESHPPTVSDYWGLINRSRHMLNAQLLYQYKPWNTSASLRANYRGKYPFADYNGNGFIDRYDRFVPQHLLLNAYLEKRILKERVKLRFTIDNILDFKHQWMPGQPGRVFIGGITYRIQR